MPTNPTATGSAGAAFEATVGAAFLALLLTRGSPPFLGADALTSVHLQAGHLGLGWQTDDILLEARDAGGEHTKAALQAKRAFVVRASDEECVKTFRGAFADFRNTTQFNQDRDAIGVVTGSLSAKLARGVRTILDCARASTSAEDMARRLAIPGYLGKAALQYYETIREILRDAEGGAPTDTEAWRFLSRFHIVDLDLDVAGGFTETMMRSLLAATVAESDPVLASATWNELITLALSDAGRAMSYTREKLPHGLLERHQKPTGYPSGVLRLVQDTRVVVDGIRTTIAGKAIIPRRELLGEVCNLIEEASLVFITGDAGSGKSALVKSAFATVTRQGVGFAFRAVSLAGSHINDVLHRFGLTLTELQAQTGTHQRKILWIESLEQLMEKPAEQRAAFLDLLLALRSDPTWRIIITARNYSAETIRAAFFGEAGLIAANVEVGELTDADLNEVAIEFPSLERPLTSETLRRLLRNPFFLDMAARMEWLDSEPLPTTERAFRAKVWEDVVRRVHEDVELGLPNSRAEVVVEVARRRAVALEPFITATDLDQRALARLVRDSVLQTALSGSNLYAPAHDVFEDWALMNWLDQLFELHNKQLAPVLGALGTHPALRRAYRRWLTESLDSAHEVTDPLPLAIVQDPLVEPHWREDTFVSILLSAGASEFLRRNAALLIAEDAKLLRGVIHILRVACRAAVPRKLFGVESEGEFFLPRGNGWIGAAELMEVAIPLFTEADLLLIVGFLEDWVLLTRYGLRHLKGARSIAAVAWHWLPLIPWRSPVVDAKKRLLRVLLAIPLAAEPQLTITVESALKEKGNRHDNGDILELIFNHFACDAIVRDFPDLAFRVAEHLLGLDRTLEEAVNDRSDYSTENISYAFGLGTRFDLDDYPPSAYHGPYLRMLWHHPDRGIDLVVRFVNRACEAFAHPNNRYEYIEPPGTIKIQVDGSWREQYANGRLFGAYRGMGVAPNSLQSALMALERWLLEKGKRDDPDLETVLTDLLRRTNNVAITAVVASVAVAFPVAAGEAAYALLTSRALLRADHDRSIQESFQITGWDGLSLGSIDAEKGIYERERKEFSALAHRKQSLEYTAVILQMTQRFSERVWSLIDSYKATLPPEAEQDHEAKVWRIQLHRIDTRNFVETGRTEDGHLLIGSSDPEPDLQEFISQDKPRFDAFDSAMAMLTWGQLVLAGKSADREKWRDHLEAAQSLIVSGYASDERAPAIGGPIYVAAVCIRDHWQDMSQEQKDWCANTVCDAIEADADTTEYFALAARNPMEKSRPAAFMISALFDKNLKEATRARLLPAIAKAVIHAVGETVSYAVQGIGQFLWQTERELALTCTQALITQAVEKYAFQERQRQRPYSERESEEDYSTSIRSELREFIVARGPADETQIGALDLAQWPGRAVSKHLFAIATQQPDDALLRIVMHRSGAVLPKIWEAYERRHHRRARDGDEEKRYDPHFEHDLVEAFCRYVVQISPEDAIEAMNPVFAVTAAFPSKAADVVNWLVLAQGDRAPASTLWTLWQRFADDFVSNVKPANVDDEHSEEAKLLRELFLGSNWNEARDWLPLHGETERLRIFFRRLPPMARAFEFYAYYLANEGTPTLPEALAEFGAKLGEGGGHTPLNETAVYYLEEILTRLIYGGNTRVRGESDLRQATLLILDALVTAGSSRGYKLRDDFLTPAP
jgi:hypothetical protein